MKEKIVRNIYALMAAIISISCQASDSSMGQKKSAICTGCHGTAGISLSSEFPNLAGQKEAYLSKQLNDFKKGSRIDPTMKVIAAALTKHDISNLAAYYSALTPVKKESPSVGGEKSEKPTKAEFPERVFVTMKKNGTVEILPDAVTWNAGPDMLYNAVTPNGKILLSTSPSSNSVYVLDTKSGKQLGIVAVGKAPKGVKVTPDGEHAYVSNQGSANVSVIDLNTLTVVATIAVEEGPHNVRFTKDGLLAYVTLQGGAGIGVIDTKMQKMIRVIPLPGITGPHNLDLSSDEKTAYVRDFVHHVAVLDLETGTINKIIKVGNGHGGIDVSPDGRFIVTAAIGDHIITVINPDTLLYLHIDVGEGPHGVRASKDSRWIYVTLTKENKIIVLNATTMKVEKAIAVGEFPFWIAVQGNP